MDTYSLLLTIFSAFFAIGLAFMIVTMVTAAKAIKKNTKLPKISANARVTGKRMDGFAVSLQDTTGRRRHGQETILLFGRPPLQRHNAG